MHVSFTQGSFYGRMLKNFLTNRSQQTKVDNSLSNITNLSSGVVQGSVIGPLLFVLFINDIANLFNDGRLIVFANSTPMILNYIPYWKQT